MNRRIYLKEEVSNHFELPYDNRGIKATIHTEALNEQTVTNMNGGWDIPHTEILKDKKDLKLFGVGKGWWEITNDSSMVNERAKKLTSLLDEKELVKKTGVKSVDKNKLSEEFKRFQKINNRVEERIDEATWGGQGGTQSSKIGSTPQSYSTGFNPKAGATNYPGYGKTVNSFLPQMDNTGNIQNYAYLQPKEALLVSIKRAIESGAPINNLDFYAEVNWNLNSMGFDAKQPLDIKEALKKMIKGK